MGQTFSTPELSQEPSVSSVMGARQVASSVIESPLEAGQDKITSPLSTNDFPSAIGRIRHHVQAINDQITSLSDEDDTKLHVYNQILNEEPHLQDFLTMYALKHSRSASDEIRILKEELEKAKAALHDKVSECDHLTEALKQSRTTNLERIEDLEQLFDEKQELQISLEEVEVKLASSRKNVDTLVIQLEEAKSGCKSQIKSLKSEVATLKTAKKDFVRYRDAMMQVHEHFNPSDNVNKKRHFDQIDHPDPVTPSLASHPHLATSKTAETAVMSPTPTPASVPTIHPGIFDQTKHTIRFSAPDVSSSPAMSLSTTPASSPPSINSVKTVKRTVHFKAGPAAVIPGQHGKDTDDEFGDEELDETIADLAEDVLIGSSSPLSRAGKAVKKSQHVKAS